MLMFGDLIRLFVFEVGMTLIDRVRIPAWACEKVAND